MRKGRLIVVDGGEGSGKDTHLALLQDRLSTDNVVFTREPGGTPFAEKIREVIFSEEAKGANALTNFFLFWAARSDHVDRLILPAIESGKDVISNRFNSSTFAYQIYGQKNNFLRGIFVRARNMLSKEVLPYIYIYLDIDPEVGLRRAANRGEGNHFDQLSLEFHRRVRTGFLEFLKHHNHVIIDTNRSREEVQQDFFDAIARARA